MAPSRDTTFNSLPEGLQRRIDRAFYSSIGPNHNNIQQKIFRDEHVNRSFTSGNANLLSGGGFLIEDHAESSGGSSNIGDTKPTHISMSSIPSALERLGISPNDEQVLAVFRNAASGWSSSTNDVEESRATEMKVSFEDWREVCTVLLGHHNEEYADDSEGASIMSQSGDEDIEDDDRYLESSVDDSDDDEYTEGSTVPNSRRHTRTRPKLASNSPPPQRKRLTSRQKQTCLEAFALFFPSLPASELIEQRITIKDIQRVAQLLGEKIKADEIIEMLDFFSSSPDKTMNLVDFERMMQAAQMA